MTDQKAIEDCQKEIHLHEKLDHVNIIKCYTSFIEDGQMYIVLELADGGDLNRLIRVQYCLLFALFFISVS